MATGTTETVDSSITVPDGVATRTPSGQTLDSDPYIARYGNLQDALLRRYGVDATSRFVDLERIGTRVHVLQAGGGEPVLILHGGAGVGAEHIPVMSSLARRFHVILPDRPGHGLSDEFDYRHRDLRQANVEFVGALLDALGITRVALIGNSFGGLMAVNFALAHPDRVARLVILSFFPGINRKLPAMMRLMVTPVMGSLLGVTVGRPSLKNTRRFFSKLIVGHIERMPDELLELEALHARRHSRGIASLFRAGINSRGFRSRYLVGDELSQLKVQTVFVWAERDAFMPADEGQDAAARISGARFLLIPDAGHMPSFDQPAQTASLLNRALATEIENLPSPV